MIVILIAGLGTWLVAGSGTDTIGASGVVFGYAGYLIARGFFTRNVGSLAIGVVVALLFGAALASDLVPRPASPGRTTCSAVSVGSSPPALLPGGRRTAQGDGDGCPVEPLNEFRRGSEPFEEPSSGSLPKGRPGLWVARPHTSVASLFAARPASWGEHTSSPAAVQEPSGEDPAFSAEIDLPAIRRPIG